MPELSRDQKAEIGALARQAWLAWPQREGFLESNGELSATECFTAWRHWQQGLACGKQSLRACTSEGDFLRLKAHFLALQGNLMAATRTLVRHASEPARIAFFKLRQALAERGLREEYAAAICRRQYRCSLAEASERQLWCLVFTVRNRRKVARSEERVASRAEGSVA